ncbi:hypothetical protein GCM10010172_53900 [Paractinoplanes ferrugineus]|uniref:Uncharacterized protein n=1 Tax=Paractinoplanes ferrugineus TaxID=113564 RepID=A0A919ML26_9ACTN|nr:DUF6461 domain-containing protein [Actinoplanes ferrugineus]GIE11792.1 hypothetical protein Afe05nite_36320 [Actinoplanes ferrugineus]
MRRRSLLLIPAAGVLSACTSRAGGIPPFADTQREAVADDYRWFEPEPEFGQGYCFTWVRGRTPPQVIEQLGGQELERISWPQLVDSGDGQQGPLYRYFIGIARVDDWSLIVEDNGDLGVTDQLVGPLSAGTTVVANHRGPDGHGRFLQLEDQRVLLDFDPRAPKTITPEMAAAGFAAGIDGATAMAATLALAERLTGKLMSRQLLIERTYLLTSVPLDRKNQ